MRILSQQILDALAGSSGDAKLLCNAWYDGQLAAEDLEVAGWSMDWNRGPQTMIQGQASFEIVDQTGRLAPWGYDEPLSVAGSRIQTTFEIGGDSVDLGWWVITSNEPEEFWRTTSDGEVTRLVPAGATIPVQGEELTREIADRKFISPESPRSGGTVFTEIARLTDGVLAVDFIGVEDRAVSRTMIYHEERINTVFDLAGMVGEYRMTGDGTLELYDPARPATPHWVIQPAGPDGTGNLIRVKRAQDRERIYNAVVSTSQNTETEIREYYTLENGPLRFYGPLGPKPKFRTAMAETKGGVQQDARTALENEVLNETTTLKVTCTPHPGYQIGDWATVANPLVDGKPYALTGQISRIHLSGGVAGLDPMEVEVDCATSEVMMVARELRKRRQ